MKKGTKKPIPLNKWLESSTQDKLASKTGFTQDGISKMLHSGRDIVVIEGVRGKVTLKETKILIPFAQRQGMAG